MNLRRHIVSLSVTAAFAIGGAAQAAEGAHWTYKGHGGPPEWGAMDAAFASCKLGKLQSPIDIVGAKPAKLSPIKFNYKPSPLKIIDNGHTIQVNYEPGSFIVVGGVRYELVQFHFHHPSEEKIDGKAHEMVAHLVHKNAGQARRRRGADRQGRRQRTRRHAVEEHSERKRKGSRG